MILHRHRVSTFLNKGKATDWSLWYSKTPTVSGPNIEVESKEFDVAQLKRIGSSRQLGSLYKENISREHIRY